MNKTVLIVVASLGLLLGASGASARNHDHKGWNNGHSQHKPEWQIREEKRQRTQAQWERDQEWQRQQREELRRRAELQRQRDEAWQRKQEAELRRRAEIQRRKDAAWQRQHGKPRHVTHASSQHHHWKRGQRYSGQYTRVSDWKHHQLHRPARGQNWVHGTSGQYLLLETASNLILDILNR